MQFLYSGDGELNRIVAWFKEHLHAVATCINNDLPEACLILIYSGIDSLGLLAAASGVSDASSKTFKDWCETYLLSQLQSIEGGPISAVDLWSARCGVLHTYTPVSALSHDGKAHEIWYQFQGKAGVKLIGSTPLPILGLDILKLAAAYKEGGLASLPT